MIPISNKTGKCPHCGVINRFEPVFSPTFRGKMSQLVLRPDKTDKFLFMCQCTNCSELILALNNSMIFPAGSSRPSCPIEVPKNIAEDYKEACLVEPLSQKAAAALSRRCLQNLLHEQGIKKRNLNEEIDEAIKHLSSSLSKSVDVIRNIGNFAAHPIKYKQTGEIVAVEPGEVEWTLDVLEQLFDYYYVQPAKIEEKRKLLNKKLKAAGKPKLK